jgi:hypothetical protein
MGKPSLQYVLERGIHGRGEDRRAELASSATSAIGGLRRPHNEEGDLTS